MVNEKGVRQRWLAYIRGSIYVAGAAVIASAGCGSSSSAAADGGKDLQAFIGTWTATSGTVSLTCSGRVSTTQVTGNDVWQMGTTTDLVQPADSSSSGCIVLANVSGNTATALPNQACTLNMGGTVVDLTIAKYTFVVGASGTTAAETATGTGAVTTNGTTTNCTYSETAGYTKSQ